MSSMSKNEETEIEAERRKREDLVIQTIASVCTNETIEFEDLRFIGECIRDKGDRILCERLAGGKTNYPYKIFLRDEKSRKALLFAKLSFPYALWSLDKSVSYDLARTDNEFWIMKRFSTLFVNDPTPSDDGDADVAPVATPYCCLDIQNAQGVTCNKLLLAQWVPADQPFADQFVKGIVDLRIMSKLANAFAVLNLVKDFDPYFNDNVRPCFRSAEPQVVDLFHELFLQKDDDNKEEDGDEDEEDECIVYGRHLGTDGFRQLIDDMDRDYMRREALVHGDAHPFNILVEPSFVSHDGEEEDEDHAVFGEKASVYICDWEMTFAGPVGQDAGKLQGWPIACAFYHAARGRKSVAYSLLNSVCYFWNAYADVLVQKGGKDKAYLAKVLRSSIGWIGYFLILVFYMLNIYVDCLPVEGLSAAKARKARGAMGAVGLCFMEYGFSGKEPDLDVEGLRQMYQSLLFEKVNKLLQITKDDQV